MRFIVEEVFDNENILRFENALKELNIEYLLVSLHNNNIRVIDKATRIPLDDSDYVLNMYTKEKDIILYGTKNILFLAELYNLPYGSFLNDQFDYDKNEIIFGQNMLNYNAKYGLLKDLEPIGDSFFIRPIGNTKLINGKVVTKEEFLSLQKDTANNSKFLNEKIMISPLVDIKSEFRFFIVDGEIASYSSYKDAFGMNKTLQITDDMLLFTRNMLEVHPLSVAYVIDIAETNDGFKIIEFNNINCSGLYNADVGNIIKKLSNLKIGD